jgi:hypothetical protein
VRAAAFCICNPRPLRFRISGRPRTQGLRDRGRIRCAHARNVIRWNVCSFNEHRVRSVSAAFANFYTVNRGLTLASGKCRISSDGSDSWPRDAKRKLCRKSARGRRQDRRQVSVLPWALEHRWRLRRAPLLAQEEPPVLASASRNQIHQPQLRLP